MSTQQNTFIKNDYENNICVTKGGNYFDTPSTPEIPALLVGNIKKTDNTFRNEYFESILNDEIRIKIINGVPTNFEYDALYCDYCDSPIGSANENEEISNGYWRCWDCQKDMCNLCHSEVNEDIAIKNGAQNYHLRKDRLQACLNENENEKHKVQKRCNMDLSIRCCDLCNSEIDLNDEVRWSEDVTNYNSKDVCQKCANTPNGMQYIFLWKMQQIHMANNLKLLWENCEFGSMMDWIPIYKDDEFNMILINCNPNSSSFKKIALAASDNHGRSGFFTIPHDIEISNLLEGMEIEYSDVCSKLKTDGNESEIKYLSAIQLLMETFNMPTYYG